MKKNIAFLVATWFGVGLIPPIIGSAMAGTYGSFAAIPLCLLAIWLYHSSLGIGFLMYALVVVAITMAGVWSVPFAQNQLGEMVDDKGRKRTKDQNQIVIDEVLGMLIACVPLLPLTFSSMYTEVLWCIVAFFAFRFFDIKKKFAFGAKYFDRMENSLGVMLDDAVAGLYAGAVVYILTLVI